MNLKEQIKEYVNKYLDNLVEHPELRVEAGVANDPVNWGSIRCIEVKKFEDENEVFILIEEAAPECYNLCDAIYHAVKNEFDLEASVYSCW